MRRFQAHGPILQAAMFGSELPDENAVERFAVAAREQFARS
jgi:hypothetical protein